MSSLQFLPDICGCHSFSQEQSVSNPITIASLQLVLRPTQTRCKEFRWPQVVHSNGEKQEILITTNIPCNLFTHKL